LAGLLFANLFARPTVVTSIASASAFSVEVVLNWTNALGTPNFVAFEGA